MLLAVCICFREHQSYSTLYAIFPSGHKGLLLELNCYLSPVYEWMLSVSSSWAPAASSCRLACCLNCVVALGWSATDLYSCLYHHKAAPYWRMGSLCLDNTSVRQSFRSHRSSRSKKHSRETASWLGLQTLSKNWQRSHVGSVATHANTPTTADVQGHQRFSFLLFLSASFSGSKERSSLHPSTSLTPSASCDLVLNLLSFKHICSTKRMLANFFKDSLLFALSHVT